MQAMQAERAVQEQRLLTAEQVSDALGLDVSTVYRMASDGRLAAVKVGRQWRFPASAADPLQAAAEPRPVATAAPAPVIDPAAARAAIGVAAELLGVMMVVTDMSGRAVTPIVNPCPRACEATPAELAECAAEWADMAVDPDLTPRFRPVALGFDCARALIRDGDRLVGMVLAGGVAAYGIDDPRLHSLDAEGRDRVLAALPRVALSIARCNEAPLLPATPTERRSA